MFSILALVSCNVIVASSYYPGHPHFASERTREEITPLHNKSDALKSALLKIQNNLGDRGAINHDIQASPASPATITPPAPPAHLINQIFHTTAELYCINTNCVDNYFVGNVSVIIDHQHKTLNFDQLNVQNSLGNAVRGEISFSYAHDIIPRGITSDLVLITGNGMLVIKGDSAATYMLPKDSYPGHAGFQIRDNVNNVILDLTSPLAPLNLIRSKTAMTPIHDKAVMSPANLHAGLSPQRGLDQAQ